jgi:hypothetical protein
MEYCKPKQIYINSACVCVCERERERQTDRQRHRQRGAVVFSNHYTENYTTEYDTYELAKHLFYSSAVLTCIGIILWNHQY